MRCQQQQRTLIPCSVQQTNKVEPEDNGIPRPAAGGPPRPCKYHSQPSLPTAGPTPSIYPGVCAILAWAAWRPLTSPWAARLGRSSNYTRISSTGCVSGCCVHVQISQSRNRSPTTMLGRRSLLSLSTPLHPRAVSSGLGRLSPDFLDGRMGRCKACLRLKFLIFAGRMPCCWWWGHKTSYSPL